jgi:plasmid rolling circle replication initiator protein Rep
MLANYSKDRIRNQEVFKYADKRLPPKSSKRFFECGLWIESLANEEFSKMKVQQANFCKNRFCPICVFRNARKDAMKIDILMKYLKIECSSDFIFVTFTAPNVKGENLKDEITRYNLAFKNLVKRDAVMAMNKGYIRKLEVTYNKERNDYHPHFHVIFAVNSSYFISRDYIKQSNWLNLWRDVMNDSTITQVDVRRVKHEKDAFEIAAYAAKDSDYTISQEVFDTFYDALKGRQILTYNGLFTEANKKYKAKELDHYKTIDTTKYVYLLLYHWGGSEYIEKWRREITEEEYKVLKKDSLDEMPM